MPNRVRTHPLRPSARLLRRHTEGLSCIKTEVHAPGFDAFAAQTLSNKKARHRRAFCALRALIPTVLWFCHSRWDRRTAVRRIQIPQQSQGVYLTLFPLPAPWRRGLVRCADERGLSPPVSQGTGGVSKGDSVPLRVRVSARSSSSSGGSFRAAQCLPCRSP